MTLPVTFAGTAGNNISTLGFSLLSGDTGSMVITAAGRARRVTNSANAQYTWPTDLPPSADYDVEADFVFLTDTTVERVGIIGRASSSARTFYMARIYNVGASTSNVQLFKAVAGTFTQLGSNYAINSSGTYNIRLSMSGSTIKVFVDDVERISVTDSSVTAAGRIGLYTSSDTQTHSDTTGFHVDNLTASFASAGQTFTQSMSASTARTASLDNAVLFGRSMSATITRSASLSPLAVISQSMSAATARTASLVGQWIEGSGPAMKKAASIIRSAILSAVKTLVK